MTVQDVVNSRWICKPLHLLDCCLETDNATCIIVTSAERARNMRQRPIHILGVAGRVSKPRLDFHWAHGPHQPRGRLLRQGHRLPAGRHPARRT